MKTKTFKIGEYCKGGIITVEIKGKKIAIIGKDWDHSKGTRRSSDQKGAKEFDRVEVQADEQGAERKLLDFAYDLTTSYHADKVMEYIKANSEIGTNAFW